MCYSMHFKIKTGREKKLKINAEKKAEEKKASSSRKGRKTPRNLVF